MVELFFVRDLEDQLAFLPLLRHPVKAQGKGPLKDLGQPLGKARVLCDDTDLGGVEGVAVEQDAVASARAQQWRCTGRRQSSFFVS